MKVSLLLLGIAGLSLSAKIVSAQDVVTSAVTVHYANPAPVAQQDNMQKQALALHATPIPETPETTTAAPGQSKSMSEELSAWVESKLVVINSYKRSNRRR